MNYPQERGDRVKYRGARLVCSLYSFRVSVHSLFSVCSNHFHQAVDKGARQCRLGRSFSTTIIPENFYLSTRPANRTFDTYDVTREGKSSPRAVSSASLALFVFAPTILLRSSVVKLPRGKKLVTRPKTERERRLPSSRDTRSLVYSTFFRVFVYCRVEKPSFRLIVGYTRRKPNNGTRKQAAATKRRKSRRGLRRRRGHAYSCFLREFANELPLMRRYFSF